ncbi:MAG: sulfurtransferase TusA family protein [Deltaproteobacteria bacterium]|nr:sulfurtransferase TusA family protein [Deltaproteobacteria bacterium]
MEGIKADLVVNCEGELCPGPVIKVAKAIKTLQLGQILEIRATDPGSLTDMDAWTKQTGNELVARREANGVFIFYVRRKK